MQGADHWLKHDNADEFFFILEGRSFVDLTDRIVESSAAGLRHVKEVVHRTRTQRNNGLPRQAGPRQSRIRRR
jgi:mannose-6-phosphate isomerase-like protein (cupin superfamily)